MFDTLLNSYAARGLFGESSSGNINLDEYEKSVYLTQAQDIIVKTYFDKTLNSQGQGFDDSARRQVDFSSLVKVADLQAEESSISSKVLQSVSFDWDGDNGSLGNVIITNKTNTQLIVSIKVYDTTEDYQGYQTGSNAKLDGNKLTLILVNQELTESGTTMSTLGRIILATPVDGTQNTVNKYINFRITNPEPNELPDADDGYDIWHCAVTLCTGC